MINSKGEWPTLCRVIKKDLSKKEKFKEIPEVDNDQACKELEKEHCSQRNQQRQKL